MGAWQDLVLAAGAIAAVLAAVLALAALVRAGGAARREDLRVLLEGVVTVRDMQARLAGELREELRRGREESANSGQRLRGEVAQAIAALSDGLTLRSTETSRQQKELFEGFSAYLRQNAADAALDLRQNHDALLTLMKETRALMCGQLDQARAEQGVGARALSEQVEARLKAFGEASQRHMGQLFDIQKAQHESFGQRIAQLTEANAKAGDALKAGVEAQLTTMRQENTAQLEQMRATVDEKLQGTLEQRLGESFKSVSERLEAVHRGLGEMQSLATGVGDLKRVLTNVKSRGTWGEVQLGALLEQVLTPQQYMTNVVTKDAGAERVEFAIRIPQGDNDDLLLPIDAKFPVEDYQRLQEAADAGNAAAVEDAAKALEARIRGSARDISSKYICPPRTTDHAILFLPSEGLYGEVLRRPGLCDSLQRDYRVIVAGPTNIVHLLSLCQMHFRNHALQKRSSEVWQVLGAIKTEFGKFGDVLKKVRKKLDEASNHIHSAEVRKRAMDRKLRQIEALPAEQSVALLGTVDGEEDAALEELDLLLIGDASEGDLSSDQDETAPTLQAAE